MFWFNNEDTQLRTGATIKEKNNLMCQSKVVKIWEKSLKFLEDKVEKL